MRIGILAAMEAEIRPFTSGLEPISFGRKATGAGFEDRIRVYQGKHEGRELVAAKCGVGKVNAAMVTQMMIERCEIDALIQVGIAGAVSPELGIGDVVIGDKYVQHDVDLTLLPGNLKPGEVVYDIEVSDGNLTVPDSMRLHWVESCPDLVAALQSSTDQILGELPRYKSRQGAIVSGDQLVFSTEKRDWLWGTFSALATEMEGAAVAQTCAANGVRFAGLRIMSDSADGSAHADIVKFLPEAARTYHEIVRDVLKQV